MRYIKYIFILLSLTLTLTGCGSMFVDEERLINVKEIPVPVGLNQETLAQLKSQTNVPTVRCGRLDKAFNVGKNLAKQGYSADDVYWEISTDESNYGEQLFYVLLADIAVKEKNGKSEPICGKLMPAFQELGDTVSLLLFSQVDTIYFMLQLREANRYNAYVYSEAKGKQAALTSFLSNPISSSVTLSRQKDYTIRGQEKDKLLEEFVKETNSAKDEIMFNLMTEATIDVILEYLYTEGTTKGNEFYYPTIEEVRKSIAKDLIFTITK